jgi:hypothetical protein
MKAWLNCNKLFYCVKLVALCLMLPACQHQGEPVAVSQMLDPKIVVSEPPPKPLTNDLVVQQAPPLPMQTTVVSIPNIKVEDIDLKLASLPPPIMSPSHAQPISLVQKRNGMPFALESYLDHRNDDAIAAIKEFPTDDQDIALIMLPILARIQQGETWASLNGPQKLAFLESLRSLNKRLSKSAPLVLQNVALVEGQPERFGEIKPRMNFNFYPEERVYAYAELVNLVDYPNADGDFNVRLDVALELVGSKGEVIWKGRKPFEKKSSISSRNDYHVTAGYTLPHHLVPGSYQLVLSVVDRESNRTARHALPLQILDSRAKTTGQPKRKA